VFLLEDEYELLADLVCGAERATPGLALLWQELQRASILSDEGGAADVVRLGSRVRFAADPAAPSRQGLILSPMETISHPRGIPVGSLMGASLIGLRVGDRFPWRGRDGRPGWLRVQSTVVDKSVLRRRRRAAALERQRLIDELLSRA
jgi:regulator of nucleoside diphosphate kinase